MSYICSLRIYDNVNLGIKNQDVEYERRGGQDVGTWTDLKKVPLLKGETNFGKTCVRVNTFKLKEEISEGKYKWKVFYKLYKVKY